MMNTYNTTDNCGHPLATLVNSDDETVLLSEDDVTDEIKSDWTFEYLSFCPLCGKPNPAQV